MKNIILILIACITWLFSYSQTGITEKEFIGKYNLPVNFFALSFDAKEHIVTYYESLPASNGKNVLPPENLVTEAGRLFMRKKSYEKAYWLFRMNIDNYPNNYKLYQEMGDYYLATGDKDRAFVYYTRELSIRYKQPSVISDFSLNIDAKIVAEYKKLAEATGRNTLPPEYLIAPIADNLLKFKKTDAAYRLYKMNYENHSGSYTAIDNFGNYYKNVGDSANAFRYWAKSVTIRYKLPDNFFSASFNPVNYLNTFYSKPAGTSLEKALPPEQMVNVLGYVFLSGKMFDKAKMLFKLNMENYPKSSNVFDSMADYYEATANKEKENEFRKQFENIQSQNPSSQRREVIADTTFDTRVAVPACKMNCPVILFDEAHNNYHTAAGRYKAFASLMENDGFKVIRGQNSFTNQLLAQVNVVVIASLGFPSQIPISLVEIQTLNDWVRKGGSLFVITDHDNMAIDELLHSFGVETQEINATTDPLHGRLLDDGTTNPSNILFSEKAKLLGNHPIIHGRIDSEKIGRVQTYAGRTVIGPAGSSALLPLSESAIDYMVVDPAQRNTSRVAVKTKGLRTHGLAFNLGKGKVVVVGEAAMLTAQLWPPNYTPSAGMNVPGSDNRQFALNVMRWLTGY